MMDRKGTAGRGTQQDISKGNSPHYLQNLVPPSVSSVSNYNLRNNNDLVVPFCRLEMTRKIQLKSGMS